MRFKIKKYLSALLAIVVTLNLVGSTAHAWTGGSVDVGVNQVRHTMTLRHVDVNGNEIAPSTTAQHLGMGTTFAHTPQQVTNYEYVGFFRQSVLGGNLGSLTNWLSGNPNVTTRLDGSDTQNGQGAYTFTMVYRRANYPITVTFEPNGGQGGPMAPQSAMSNQAFILNSNTFFNPGHTFAGWARNPRGPVEFTNNAAVTFSGDTTLFAIWQHDQSQWRTISFHPGADDVVGNMVPQQVIANLATPLNLNLFARAGYDFDGWAMSPTGGVVFTDGEVITTFSNMNLYARWVENPDDWATVTFDANATGATGTMASQRGIRGSMLTLNANAFELQSHDFAGWSTTPTGPVEFADGGEIRLPALGTTDNVQLFAVWDHDGTPDEIEIEFHGNGGVGNMPNQTAAIGTPTNLNTNNFTRAGFIFLGWSTVNSGIPMFSNEAVIIPTEDMTLFAVWGQPNIDTIYGRTTTGNAEIGDDVEFYIQFESHNSMNATTLYRPGVEIQLDPGLTVPTQNNFHVTRNGQPINVNTIINPHMRQITVLFDQIAPGDLMEIRWVSVATATGDHRMTFRGTGGALTPLGFAAFRSDNYFDVSGEVDVNIIDSFGYME